MPTNRRKTIIKKKIRKATNTACVAVRPTKPNPRLDRHSPADLAEVARMRVEADTAVAEARKSHERLREAIDILPQGIVFLDADGRYILWNKKYSEIYSRSSDLFEPSARLTDTIRIGVARGDYPEAIGREEEGITDRLAGRCHPS